MLDAAELQQQAYHDAQDYAPSREGTPADMSAFLASIRAETEAKIQAESRLATLKKQKSDADDSGLSDDIEEEVRDRSFNFRTKLTPTLELNFALRVRGE